MISSIDEFLLLAKKWRSELKSVCIMSVARASDQVLAVVHAEGQITNLTSDRLDIADEHRASIATVFLNNVTFNYGIAADIVGEDQAKYYDDCIMVTADKDGKHALITVLSVKPKIQRVA